MAIDDDAPRRKITHDIGQDLTPLSVDELDARIDLLKSEIGRLEEARRTKTSMRSAAESFFKI